MSESFPQTLGKYQVLEEIGHGSFATVYKALDPELQREIALKVLDPRLARDEVFVQRFVREARSAANLQHPNIVVVHEVGEVEGTYFIAMAYLPGPPLVELIAKEAPVTVERAIELLSPIADALDYAHGQGFIHRDVKPSNIILDARGQPVLTDFGLVRAGDVSSLSSLGMPIGTPYYMAPEQASGEPVNRRVDLYSLAVVFFEMLTGEVPFQADTPVAVLYQHVHETPPDLSTLDLGIPVPVAQVVKRALAKGPSWRYPSGRALIAALQDALAWPPSPGPAEPVRSREPAREVEPTREVKSWTKLALVGCLTVLLCGIIGIGSWIELWPKLFPQGTPTVAETGIPAPSVTPSPTPKQVKPTSITTPGPTEKQVKEVEQTPAPSGGPTPSATATQTAVPLSQRPGRPAGEAYTDGAISVAADKELNVDSRYIYITLKIQNQTDDKQLIRWRNDYLHLVDDKGREYYNADETEGSYDMDKQFNIDGRQAVEIRATDYGRDFDEPHRYAAFVGPIDPTATYLTVTMDRLGAMSDLTWRYDLVPSSGQQDPAPGSNIPSGEAYTLGGLSVAMDKEINVDSTYIYVTFKVQNDTPERHIVRWRNNYLHLVDDKGREYLPADETQASYSMDKQFGIDGRQAVEIRATDYGRDFDEPHRYAAFVGPIDPMATYLVVTMGRLGAMSNLTWRYDLVPSSGQQSPAPGSNIPAGEAHGLGGVSVAMDKQINVSSKYVYITFKVQNDTSDRHIVRWRNNYLHLVDDKGRGYLPVDETQASYDMDKQFGIDARQAVEIRATDYGRDFDEPQRYAAFVGPIDPTATYLVVTMGRLGAMSNLTWRYDLVPSSGQQSPAPGSNIPAGEAYGLGGVSVAMDKQINVSSKYVYITFKVQNDTSDRHIVRWRNNYLHLVDDKGREYLPVDETQASYDMDKQFGIDARQTAEIRASDYGRDFDEPQRYAAFVGPIDPTATYLIVTMDRLGAMSNLTWKYQLAQ